jgi:hypothetical protein
VVMATPTLASEFGGPASVLVDRYTVQTPTMADQGVL